MLKEWRPPPHQSSRLYLQRFTSLIVLAWQTPSVSALRRASRITAGICFAVTLVVFTVRPPPGGRNSAKPGGYQG